jgi:hypothetical protein
LIESYFLVFEEVAPLLSKETRLDIDLLLDALLVKLTFVNPSSPIGSPSVEDAMIKRSPFIKEPF